MKRRDFLASLSLLPLITKSMNLSDIKSMSESFETTPMMPILFVGHGSPTNALEDNEFVKGWQQVTAKIPKPNAILCISAHWLTKGTQVTAMPFPKTIHDFGGFSEELFQVEYPAKGSKEVAESITENVHKTHIIHDTTWGLDHGTWVPIMKMYPKADIPVLQLSIDYSQGAAYHYELAKELMFLRSKGVLIIGSGNMVHNLGMMSLPRGWDHINDAYGFDWALELNEIFKNKIKHGDHASLIQFEKLHKHVKYAIPTTDHYFPLLYILALQKKNEQAHIFNDKAIAGSLTMTSVLIH